MASKKDTPHKLYGKLKGQYRQKSVKKRIEALFLDNIGKVVTREQIIKAATDPGTGQQPENWHQRLSELRTDHGYTILSWRNRGDLKVQEYLMPHTRKRSNAGKLNTYAIVQFAPETEKKRIFSFLLSYFGYNIRRDGTIGRQK